jgi:hypothetical protein
VELHAGPGGQAQPGHLQHSAGLPHGDRPGARRDRGRPALRVHRVGRPPADGTLAGGRRRGQRGALLPRPGPRRSSSRRRPDRRRRRCRDAHVGGPGRLRVPRPGGTDRADTDPGRRHGTGDRRCLRFDRPRHGRRELHVHLRRRQHDRSAVRADRVAQLRRHGDLHRRREGHLGRRSVGHRERDRECGDRHPAGGATDPLADERLRAVHAHGGRLGVLRCPGPDRELPLRLRERHGDRAAAGVEGHLQLPVGGHLHGPADRDRRCGTRDERLGHGDRQGRRAADGSAERAERAAQESGHRHAGRVPVHRPRQDTDRVLPVHLRQRREHPGAAVAHHDLPLHLAGHLPGHRGRDGHRWPDRHGAGHGAGEVS